MHMGNTLGHERGTGAMHTGTSTATTHGHEARPRTMHAGTRHGHGRCTRARCTATDHAHGHDVRRRDMFVGTTRPCEELGLCLLYATPPYEHKSWHTDGRILTQHIMSYHNTINRRRNAKISVDNGYGVCSNQVTRSIFVLLYQNE